MAPRRSPREPRKEASGSRRETAGRARIRISSDSPERSFAVARALGAILPAGAAVSLEGGLGAGKTLFAKGICAGLGVRDEVTSPSFVLVEEYRGRVPVLHFDLYRLEKVDDAAEIGLFDAIDGRTVVIVEWGDRLPSGVVAFDVVVKLRITGPESRAIFVESGKDLGHAVERLR